ncbi:MAG: hypothetical protein LBL00_08185, partial [Endomicrobium sp.]|nr:hypothetical protein [Endomicrobium sp.]
MGITETAKWIPAFAGMTTYKPILPFCLLSLPFAFVVSCCCLSSLPFAASKRVYERKIFEDYQIR